jgi:acetyl esterase/lipase
MMLATPPEERKSMRRTRLIAQAVLVNLCLLAPAAAQAPRQDPDWLREFAHKRIVYSVPGMRRVRVRRDLTYKRVAGTELKMDVYSPPGARGARRPAVIFIHGGRIPPNLRTTPKDWGAYVSFGQLVAASGFVGVTFNHRFHTWDSLPDSQADLSDLIAYVRGHADSLGVDRERIVLWSVSAGGIFLSRPLKERPPYLRCVVAYYSELDLQGQRASAPASVTDETLREFSPLRHLGGGGGFPPFFVARAGLDDAGLNAGIDRFVQAALSKNLTIEVLNHATGHHGFDVEDDNERSREIIRRTVEFIRAHG